MLCDWELFKWISNRTLPADNRWNLISESRAVGGFEIQGANKAHRIHEFLLSTFFGAMRLRTFQMDFQSDIVGRQQMELDFRVQGRKTIWKSKGVIVEWWAYSAPHLSTDLTFFGAMRLRTFQMDFQSDIVGGQQMELDFRVQGRRTIWNPRG